MTNEVLSLLTQSSGAALVTGIFIWYLTRFNKLVHEERQQTNLIIGDYLRESTRVKQHLAEKLQEFSDVSREQRDVIEKLYIELVKKHESIRNYQRGKKEGARG